LNALFLETFEKDLRKIKDKKALKSIQNLVLRVESAKSAKMRFQV
jgi:hypothetical protein